MPKMTYNQSFKKEISKRREVNLGLNGGIYSPLCQRHDSHSKIHLTMLFENPKIPVLPPL